MLSLLLSILPVLSTSFSLIKMGLMDVKTGEERFNILYEAHVKAKEKGLAVDYSGIDTIRLSIPIQARSIPLGEKTDFKGTVFVVDNDNKENFFLFSLCGKADTLKISNNLLIDTGNFKTISCLKTGFKMLVIEDQNPWIDNRRGFSYGMKRRDILLLNNGQALNHSCAPYNNEYSNPICTSVSVSKEVKSFSNAVLHRTATSKRKTFFVKFENQYNVHISNIGIVTPDGTGQFGDTGIFLKDCANVSMNNVNIDGSYSLNDKWGYGISLNNVYNIDFDQIEGNAPWGVFGNNNVNKARLKNSHVNRFDVHCYGRDFFFENCLFDKSGFLYSSIYGDVRFEQCTFKNVFPCLNRIDFNAYTPFNIVFANCDFYFDNSHYALVNLSDIDDIENPRQELSDKCIPNVQIENCSINLCSGIEYVFAFYVGGCKYSKPIKGLSFFSMKNITVSGTEAPMKMFNTYVRTEKAVDLNIDHVSYQERERRIPNYRFFSETMLNHSEPKKKALRGHQYIK